LKFPPNNPCPCGSQKKYKKCCKVFHDGNLPTTALKLMKSRYSAFAVHKAEYIIATTHSQNQDFTSDISSWKKGILDFCENTSFNGLEIIDFIDGELESYVTFKAILEQANQDATFTEKSRFLKENGKWLYVDGKFID
jgi:SEC-C motif-containing protein